MKHKWKEQSRTGVKHERNTGNDPPGCPAHESKQSSCDEIIFGPGACGADDKATRSFRKSDIGLT
jgi:hypothetical protein